MVSFKHYKDGFELLLTFCQFHSPQFQGKFIDFRQRINKINIIPGEHILYTHVQDLSTEIRLARIKDGSDALL